MVTAVDFSAKAFMQPVQPPGHPQLRENPVPEIPEEINYVADYGRIASHHAHLADTGSVGVNLNVTFFRKRLTGAVEKDIQLFYRIEPHGKDKQ